jgi:hypothetical protein
MPKYKIKVVGWEVDADKESITINPDTVKDGGDEIELNFKDAMQFENFLDAIYYLRNEWYFGDPNYHDK